ncbi:MAG: hypothetical protein M1812_005076 [Candelaria pacifica]|nr:MAG: hypothetical protein M1812_005076 [Candelaria pacifica]
MTSPPPIVFVSPGGTLDTCLTVFGQEFHAESVVLRQHSGFFRTFLSLESEPSSAEFKYEYVSKIDKDGTWGLQPKSTVLDDADFQYELLNSSQRFETRGFHNLLKALYTRRYRDQCLPSFAELLTLVRLADFYRALPIVSVTLDASLPSLFYILEHIPNDCAQVLNTAHQIRSPLLFKESFIHVVARVNLYQELILKVDTELHKLVFEHLAVLRAKVSGVSHTMHTLIAEASDQLDFTSHQMILPAMVAASRQLEHRVGLAEEPRFYRLIYEAAYRPSESQYQTYVNWCESNYKMDLSPETIEAEARAIIMPLIAPLMVSNLQYRSDQRVGENVDYFLCTHLVDSDLPWDLTETDW